MRTGMVALALGAAAATVCAVLLPALISRPPARLVVRNHRHRDVPAVLGIATATASLLTVVVGVVVVDLAARGGGAAARQPWRMVAVAAAAGLVAFAGLTDDLSAGGPRGLRAHLGALARGRLTTGVGKLVMAVGAGAIVAFALGPTSVARGALITVIVAGSANLWNGLDVVPGRALKAFVPLAAVVLVLGPRGPAGLVLAAVAGAALAVLPADLTERGMLGDAGSNLVGLALGAGAAEALSTPWLAVVTAVVVALNLVAETVTFSRAIDALPPLRWADRALRAPTPRPTLPSIPSLPGA